MEDVVLDLIYPMHSKAQQLLNEMNEKAQKLVELMKDGIVEFIFRKKSTGKLRRARGTLDKDLVPPEARRKRGRPRKRASDLVVYYDVDKKAIRSFKDYLLRTIKSKKAERPVEDKEEQG